MHILSKFRKKYRIFGFKKTVLTKLSKTGKDVYCKYPNTPFNELLVFVVTFYS